MSVLGHLFWFVFSHVVAEGVGFSGDTGWGVHESWLLKFSLQEPQWWDELASEEGGSLQKT